MSDFDRTISHIAGEYIQMVKEAPLHIGYEDAVMNDSVNKPKHYTAHPSGIECIEITEHMGFNLGNAIKYIWRCNLKKDAVEDLKKAVWYINREISKREKS